MTPTSVFMLPCSIDSSQQNLTRHKSSAIIWLSYTRTLQNGTIQSVPFPYFLPQNICNCTVIPIQQNRKSARQTFNWRQSNIKLGKISSFLTPKIRATFEFSRQKKRKGHSPILHHLVRGCTVRTLHSILRCHDKSNTYWKGSSQQRNGTTDVMIVQQISTIW